MHSSSTYKVVASKSVSGDWDSLCSCGYNSTRFVMCKHTFVAHNYAPLVPLSSFLKPWTTWQSVYIQLGRKH
eukprot:972188-Pleurochrysis_carterae.AAC.1